MAARSKVKVEKPKTDAAIASEQIAQAIFTKIDVLIQKLKKNADAGNKEARDKLNFLRWDLFQDFKKDMEQKARAGQIGWPPPIRTILEMADFAIPLLFELTELQKENIKGYAQTRWAWPAYVHLLPRAQKKYKLLLPKYNQIGTKVLEESPIELGKNLPLKLNPRRTKGDLLFQIGASAIIWITEQIKPDSHFDINWSWLYLHHEPLSKIKGAEYQNEARNFLLSLGKLTQANWANWLPVVETYLTWNGSTPEEKFKLLPPFFQSNMHAAIMTGTERQWFENFRKSKKLSVKETVEFLDYLQKVRNDSPLPLVKRGNPEIREIVNRRKKEAGKWIELKDEIRKRIFDLLPVS